MSSQKFPITEGKVYYLKENLTEEEKKSNEAYVQYYATQAAPVSPPPGFATTQLDLKKARITLEEVICTKEFSIASSSIVASFEELAELFRNHPEYKLQTISFLPLIGSTFKIVVRDTSVEKKRDNVGTGPHVLLEGI